MTNFEKKFEKKQKKQEKISTNLDPTFDNKIFLELNKEYNKYIGEYYSPFKIQKLLESIDELIEKNNLQFVEHLHKSPFVCAGSHLVDSLHRWICHTPG